MLLYRWYVTLENETERVQSDLIRMRETTLYEPLSYAATFVLNSKEMNFPNVNDGFYFIKCVLPSNKCKAFKVFKSLATHRSPFSIVLKQS